MDEFGRIENALRYWKEDMPIFHPLSQETRSKIQKLGYVITGAPKKRRSEGMYFILSIDTSIKKKRSETLLLNAKRLVKLLKIPEWKIKLKSKE